MASILTLVISSCHVVDDDILPVSSPLTKGEKLKNAALISTTLKESIIKVKDKLDDEMAKNETFRPKIVSDYKNIKSITLLKKTPKDLLSSSFSWEATSNKKIMVAIFRDVIKVENNEISNKEDIVWLWTSQNNKDSGTISLNDGKISTFHNNKFILANIQKTGFALPVGTYVWCVWAWDDYGLNIVASSREIPFEVLP